VASFASVYAANRTTIVGAGAAVVIAVAAVIGLRNRTPTVQVVAAAPDAVGAAGGVGFGDISAAYGAGASAASSGLGVGSDLGQAALGLAGNVVDSQGYVAQTLAGSQADVAQAATTDFAAIIAALIGAGQTTVPPPPSVVYTFQPPASAPAPVAAPVPIVKAPAPVAAPVPIVKAPAPVAAPVPIVKAPAPAPVVIRHGLTFAKGARVRVYNVSSRGCINSWTDYTAAAGTATCGAAYHLSTCAGTSGATVVGVWSGAYAGHIIAINSGVTYR